MKRKITGKLLEWKDDLRRKPLILNGARQVGKTFILEQFGQDYFENFVHLNMEKEEELRSFLDTDIRPENIIPFIETIAQQKITAGKTLVLFDEIQSCERALTSLKYFCEDTPQYHIAAAGSLLGVAINREKYSFPVGKVTEMYLYPLDFEEFLWALGYNDLIEEIKIHYTENTEINSGLHKLAMDLYRKYCIIGGMPASVQTFVETGSFLKSQNVQNEIVNEYIADMSKYAPPATSIKIKACYNSIPIQLAKENKKFQYKIVQKGGTATIFGEAIEWLNFAGIVLKCQKINHGNLPIAVYADLTDFKLYMADTGMLTMKSNMPPQLIVSSNEDNTYLGFLTENYVAQCFIANRLPLFYWKNDNTAEVDFVLQLGDKVVPVEVKKGINTRSKSLGMFIKKYNCDYAIRISSRNFGFENNIKSVPLYAAFCIQNH